MRITDTHYYFWNTIYSQWFMSTDKDYLFEENGIGFITAEHYMMYYKALVFGDLETAGKILKTVHPRDVKRLGRLVKNYDDSVWNEKRFDVVVNGNILNEGDSVAIIKDLKVKGSSSVLKIGTKVKNIRLVDGDHNIDCQIDGFGAMKLKSEFVKKI